MTINRNVSRLKTKGLKVFLGMGKSNSKIVFFGDNREIEDEEETKDKVLYISPVCKAHLPKPNPVKMKVLFSSKTVQGLSIPIYKE